MTNTELAALAAAECSSAETTAHHGGGAGRPFWNINASQFMYVPAFHFAPIPGRKRYRYTAEDETGARHVFEASTSEALLTPIWAELPEGRVTLHVCALDAEGREDCPVGTRTFFRLSPFPADLAPRARSYTDAARLTYDYVYSQNYIQHWLTEGTPDPDYDWYVYPSKMEAAVIQAMLRYRTLRPEKAEDALRIARAAADYLISRSRKEGEPLAGLPLTYEIDFRDHPETRQNLTAADRLGTVMTIYPATAGSAYLKLEEATGDPAYLQAAEKIGQYYLNTVQPNGSWFLIVSLKDGAPVSGAYCLPLEVIVPFLKRLAARTGDSRYDRLAAGAAAFVEREKFPRYDWEGQFEDSFISVNYSNMTHYGAESVINYDLTNFAGDAAHLARSEELMRFVEDQFVVWKRPAPWNLSGFDTSQFTTPCAYEQYEWYVPIDASTASIASSFLALHRATGKELYLAKAKALCDSITRVQRADGFIPTHWMNDAHRAGKNLWINCMLYTAGVLAELGAFLGETPSL